MPDSKTIQRKHPAYKIFECTLNDIVESHHMNTILNAAYTPHMP